MCGAVRLKGFMVKKNLHQLIVLFDRETPKVREESTLPCFANGEMGKLLWGDSQISITGYMSGKNLPSS